MKAESHTKQNGRRKTFSDDGLLVGGLLVRVPQARLPLFARLLLGRVVQIERLTVGSVGGEEAAADEALDPAVSARFGWFRPGRCRRDLPGGGRLRDRPPRRRDFAVMEK